MHSVEKKIRVLLCVWLMNSTFVRNSFGAALYQGVVYLNCKCVRVNFHTRTDCTYFKQKPDACGQRSIFVNGQHRSPCPNEYFDGSNSCIPYIVPQCPAGYILANGFCYLSNKLPANICPSGFYFSDQLCYPYTTPLCPSTPIHLPPYEIKTEAPSQETTQAPTPTSPPKREPEPASQPMLPPDPATRCPSGSIFSRDKCRKQICPMGEYYKGRCLLAACPEGTVWYQHRCQEPGYIKTILEIDHIFINEAH